jgi:hypothetical protein
MIQRVQSLYLLLVTILMSFLLVRPYADLTLANNESLLFKAHAIVYQSSEDAVTTYKTTIPVVLIVLAVGLISFCTIFFYNNRRIQIKLSILNMFLILILIICMLIYYILAHYELHISRITFRFAMIFPVLALIFCIMAIRAIRHDEILVNSYKRMR